MALRSLGKDHIGAAICVLLGAGVVALGVGYGVGTPGNMGSGFVPVMIGGALVVVGLALGVAAPRAEPARFVDEQRSKVDAGPEWRGWACILGGLIAFIVLGKWGGLLPASFFAVFISALGDRNNSVKASAILAAVLAIFAALVFHFLLALQLPLFGWGP